MKLHSTDLEREDFDYKDDKTFLLKLIAIALSAFIIGVVLAVGILFAVLSLSDKI